METFPLRVFELVGQESRGPGLRHAVQGLDQRIGTDDPEHVKPAQRINGHQTLDGWGTFGGAGLGSCSHGQLSSRYV